MTERRSVLVFGSSEFGETIRELVIACGHSFAGFIDDWRSGPEVVGTLAVVSASHDPAKFEVALAVGYKHLAARRQLAVRLSDLGYSIVTLVHPQAYVAPSATVGEGVIIMARAAIDVRVHVGPLTVIWPGVIISHDSELSGNTFVSPAATICGRCRIGVDSFLGAGSIIVNDVNVPSEAFLKAGEVYKGIKSAPNA